MEITNTDLPNWFNYSLLPNLTQLSITNYPNQLANFPQILGEITGHELLELRLDQNHLERIPEQLNSFRSLQKLSLIGNDVIILRNDSFNFPESLKLLNLNHNPLLWIEPNAFQGSTSQLQIQLENIKLQVLDQNVFEDLLRNGTELLFSEDVSFLCNCNIAWLVRDPELSQKLNITCFSQELGRILISQLKPENFSHCDKEPTHPWVSSQSCGIQNSRRICFPYSNSLVPFNQTNTKKQYFCRRGFSGKDCTLNTTQTYEDVVNSTATISTGNLNLVIEIEFARLWACQRNSCDLEDQYELPNTFALVSFWCNGKSTCNINPAIIQSYSNIRKPVQDGGNNNSDINSPNLLTFDCRWRKRKPSEMKCPIDFIGKEDCYRIDNSSKTWQSSREAALDSGFDLSINSSKILQSGIDFTNIPYIWIAKQPEATEQRTPDNYFDPYYQGQTNLLTGSSTNQTTTYGLWVSPPEFLPADESTPVVLTTIWISKDPKGKCPRECFPQYESNYCWQGWQGIVPLLCPGNSARYATWECRNGEWVTPRPNLSNCTTLGDLIQDAIDQLGKDKPVPEIIDDLREQLENKNLIAGDLKNLELFLQKALEAQDTSLSLEQDPGTRYKSAQNFTQSILNLANLTLDQREGWWGLPNSQRQEHFATFCAIFEETVVQLVNNVHNGNDRETYWSENLVFQRETLQLNESESDEYPIILNGKEVATIELNSFIEENRTDVNLIVFQATTASQVLSGDEITRWKKRIASGLLNLAITTTNAPVFGIRVMEDPGSENNFLKITLSKEVITSPFDVILRRIIKYQNISEKPNCISWDPSISNWSSDSCNLQSTTEDNYTCNCNGSVKVTVLAELETTLIRELVLKYITYYGGIISSVALGFSILIFVWVPAKSARDSFSKDSHITIHANLCFNLLAAQIIYMVGLENVDPGDSPSCVSITFFLHLSYLASFAWMVIEAVYIYFKIYRPFETSKVTIVKCLVFAYGVPLCITLMSFLSTYFAGTYISSDACWIGDFNALMGGFVAPVSLGLAFNAAIYVAILVVALRNRRKRNDVQLGRDKSQKKSAVARILLSAFLLSFLLGITWIFTILYVLQTKSDWAYAFTVVNATQGIFIVYYTCAANESVRDAISKKLLKHGLKKRLDNSRQQQTPTAITSQNHRQTFVSNGYSSRYERPSDYRYINRKY